MKKLLIAFAAFSLLAGTSCSKFDDSKLNGRIDDLEGRVDSIEDEIEQLKQNIDGFNNTLKEFTNILNGSIITDVKRNSADNGWLITIQNVQDQTTSTFEVMDGSQGPQGPAGPAGPQGPQGETGEDGHTPVITTATDENGTYWVIDGQPTNPKVYATGEKGEAGKTPQLAIAADNGSGTPDFNNEGEDLYWWVSYDYPGTGDKSTYTWTKLYTANTTAVKLDLTVEYKDGELIFYNAGVEIGRAAVQLSENDIAVSYTVDEAEFNEFDTLRFAKGQKKVVVVEISGSVSENVIVKADLQNNNGTFAAEVDDENNITVTPLVSGATNKLLVEVLDGAKCYHSWVKLVANIPTATIYIPATDEYDYIPVAFGTGFESLDNVPVKPEIIVEIDMPAVEDITFNVEWTENEIANTQLNSKTVTISKGQTSTNVDFEITKRVGLENDTFGCFVISTDDEAVVPEDAGAWLGIANNFDIALSLKAEDLYCQWTHGGHNVESTGKLVDGSIDASSYWESYWSVSANLPTDPVFGIRIDIDVTKNDPIPAEAYIVFKHYPRNGTVPPTAVTYGCTADGSAETLGSATFDITVDWQKAFVPAKAGIKKLHFGITESAQGTMIPELEAGYCHCAGLREIAVSYMF